MVQIITNPDGSITRRNDCPIGMNDSPFKPKEKKVSLLYDRQHKIEDTFTYESNSCNASLQGTITIKFINKRFDSVSYPFTGSYPREAWVILAEIEREISRIEKEFSEERDALNKLALET